MLGKKKKQLQAQIADLQDRNAELYEEVRALRKSQRKVINDLRRVEKREQKAAREHRLREESLMAEICLYEQVVQHAVTDLPKFVERLEQAYHTPIDMAGKVCMDQEVSNRRIDAEIVAAVAKGCNE